MHKLIPKFINDRFNNDERAGKFQASTMFIDISGFTAMTQSLMVNGKEGAEALTEVINQMFTPAINAIYEHNGFVSTFAGDAFTSIFPSDKASVHDALSAAIRIRELFQTTGLQQTKFGSFDLSIKIGLSLGDVEWGIIQQEQQNAYYFKGDSIDHCAESDHHAAEGEIVFDDAILSHIFDLPDATYQQKVDRYYLLKSAPLSPAHSVAGVPDPSHQDKFIPDDILKMTSRGEFRDIISCFISFKSDALDVGISKVIALAHSFGGYFNKIDFGDKDIMLVLFGAPVNPGNLYNRALDFALAVKDIPELTVRIGLTFGTAFTGFVGSTLRGEYTALGSVVNLSARFIQKAKRAVIYLDRPIYKQVQSRYEIKELKPRRFKGFKGAIPIYRLIERKKTAHISFYEGEMVGRDVELNRLVELLQPVKDGKFGGIVYVYGNPGIGKSRLIYELIQQQGIRTLTLQTDSILKKPLNPFTYIFNQYFEQAEAGSLDDRKTRFKTIFQELIRRVESLPDDRSIETAIKELHRIESIIGSVIGLFWKGSVYDIIDPKDRPVVTQLAIKEFFTVLSLIEPIIMLIEDIQWLDDESNAVFEILTRKIEDYPLIILACSRFNDDGSKPELKADEDVPRHEITLDELSGDTTRTLIEDRLGQQVNDELTAYIQSRTEGNPFYTEQFCLYLRENNIIELEEGQYRLIKEPVDIPTGINMILIARIDRLSAELKETVQIASVLGREFEVQVLTVLIDLLQRVTPDERTALRDMEIRPLISRVEEERIWSALTEIRYIFSHALLRDAVYEMQLKARLRSLHKLAGDTIVEVYLDDKTMFADTAYHYELAEDWGNAREYCQKAGFYFKESIKYDEASIYLQKALSICERIYAPDHSDIATSLNNLALLYQDQGFFNKAKSLYLKALEIRKHVLGNQHPDFAASVNDLASLYHLQGLYDKAEPLYLKALEIRETVLGQQHTDVSTILNNLAALYDEQGLYDKAKQLYIRALEIDENVLGPQHPDVATSLNNLAGLYLHEGHYDEAEPLWERAMEIRKTVLGQQHPDVAITLNNQALLYHSQGLYDKAEPLYERALEIYEIVLGSQHPLVATSLNNLALLYKHQGFYDKAEPLLKRALEIREKVLEPQHPDVALGLNNLAELYREQGLYDKAEQLFKRAIKIWEQALPDHPNLAVVIENYAKLLKEAGRDEEAKVHRDRAQAIRDKNAQTNS